MQVTIGAPLAKVKNKFKLAITSMLGDADGYDTKVTYYDKFEGELEEIYKIFKKEIAIAHKGLCGGEVLEMEERILKTIYKNPILRTFLCETEDEDEDIYVALDYLCEICKIGESDVGYRHPDEMVITYFNTKGEECSVKIQKEKT